MKKILTRVLREVTPLLLLISVGLHSISQDKKPIPIFTADSLKSGNYKDVFLSFFQLAFENLVGTRKELRFTANPYAIMMRADPNLAVDTSYVRYTALRKLNFSVGLRVDSNFKFNGFTSGVNYSIINKRDYTIYRSFLDSVEKKNKMFSDMTDAVTAMTTKLASEGKQPLAKKLNEQWDALANDTKLTIDQVPDSVRQVLLEAATSNEITEFVKIIKEKRKVNVRTEMNERYRLEKDKFKNKFLWTVGILDTTFQDQFFFSNIVFNTQLMKGFSNPLRPNGVEFNVKAAYNIVDDTLRAGRDLRRGILNFEGGVNWVRRHRSTDLSFFEFQARASFRKVFSGMYADERREIFTLIGTLRFRIFEEIWIPLEFEYDPAKGNVFGFINARLNFTALKKAVGKN